MEDEAIRSSNLPLKAVHTALVDTDTLLPSVPSRPNARWRCLGPGCGKIFTRNFTLQNHQRIHTKERPFSCSVCQRAFTRLHDKTTHEKSHSDSRRYVCKGKDGVSGCGSRFTRSFNLSGHMRTCSRSSCPPVILSPGEALLEPRQVEGGPVSTASFSLSL